MKQKTIVIILALGIVLGGLAFLLNKKDGSGGAPAGSAMGQKVLPNFPLNDVTGLTIQGKTGKVELARQEDNWKVVSHFGYPASFDQISGLVKKVWELKVTQDVAIGASQFPRLNLVSPDSPEAASSDPAKVGTLVIFTGEGGKELGRLLLGLEHTSGAAAPSDPMASMMGGGGSMPNGRYLAAGKDPKTAVLVSESFSSASEDAKEWLDHNFIRVERPKTITVTGPTPETSWKLTREADTEDFKLDAPAAGEDFDTANSGVYKSVLGSVTFTDVAPKDDADAKKLLEKPTVAEITTFDGFTYKVQIGGANPAGDVVTLWEINADLKKERTVPADEKPEAKEAADKAFAEQLKTQEEKLAKEKAFENWNYYVQSYVVQNLTKPRADLMKKPEPPAGSQGAPNGGGGNGGSVDGPESGPMITPDGVSTPPISLPGLSPKPSAAPAPEPEASPSPDAAPAPSPEGK